ncbi:MAG: glycosyl hydrolase 115 family protein [Lachnospiraceae bacterium]|nr:glycosyl hydrolase 115 family protein [Lachnospiraceae bacterium]
MIIRRYDSIRIVVEDNGSEAVRIAAANLARDFETAMDVKETAGNECAAVIRIVNGDENLPREGYTLKCKGNELLIRGADRRGTIYGIYTFSEMLGISPWYFMADVPVPKTPELEIVDGFETSDHPVVEYRGIFINDEEELDKWVSLHMGENTIGVNTYAVIFELLLRLKMNYIWPAMHVNSFNMNRENGELAERMGIVVGTSHCDMLMRSNNREWIPWVTKKGYAGAKYDYSIPGRNREILNEYWAESVDQNKDFEVSYTLGMRGVHDSGFEVRNLSNLMGKALVDAKTKLLEEIIETQEKIIADRVSGDVMKLFVPYKEVLELYDNGLKVPEDVTLVWVNDNYGYVRRYPSEEEKNRAGGNGIYYHNSYWAPPGNSYMFVNTIPLAHTANELRKAYAEGIRKLWVTNFGTLKPFEEEMSFFADLAWETGKKSGSTDDVDLWLKSWLSKTFGTSFLVRDLRGLAILLNDFDQISNVRKIEHLDIDNFALKGYGDEGGHRLLFYEKIFKKANDIWKSLPQEQQDAFFELVVMKIHAVYYSNAMFYYADRSNLCMRQGKRAAAHKYTLLSLKFERLRKQMIYYYNNVMAEGKWSGILTPEDFPPPRTACFPPCMPPFNYDENKMVVTTWSGDDSLSFNGFNTKWIEIANAGMGEIGFEIVAPKWLNISCKKGKVAEERRIFVENLSFTDCSGVINVSCLETGEKARIPVTVKKADKREDDRRIVIEGTDFVKEKGRVSVIARLGRDHGNLVQLDEEGASVSYNFSVTDEKAVATLIIHRFPTLNSVGRIRAKITLDRKNYLYEAEARDEHMANWKDNVQNNVDTGCPISVPLTAGEHTLTVTCVDRYFAFSRLFLLLDAGKRFNTGTACYGDDLPGEFDTEKAAEQLYGHIKLDPPREIFTTLDEVKNANTDYDAYKPGEYPVPLDEWKRESLRTYREIFRSAKKPFEREFDAAAAMAGTDFAFIEDKEHWLTYCNSPSHGGCGLAMYVRKKDMHFTYDTAPALNYCFETFVKDKYTLWLRLFMWGDDQSHFEVTIDGERFEQRDFIKPALWSYSSENTWKWYPVCVKELSPRRHMLTVRLLDSRLRIDKIRIDTM